MNKTYAQQMRVDQVPCYGDYLQIHCLGPVSSATLDSIDRTAQQLDWIEVLVYDQGNNLIRGETGSM
ncbi:hypothetical protein E5K00_18260 [Hymenobacter aquaticus]|uniref:Uncharacterized protein n=1 Tax=Hymenobacter aquaticus TaxID=1867101 RepID=A0A4Z0PZ65_9BACT|nr:hypothetical protein [Hymenobacter aquaticus]TGE22191.1 hypothetical protein E5K00_18260 [Hymenobacter aquaticus]